MFKVFFWVQKTEKKFKFLKSGSWKPTKKTGCSQIVEKCQAWKPKFFFGKIFDTHDGSCTPPIFFWNEESTWFSHRSITNDYQKKWKPPNIGP